MAKEKEPEFTVTDRRRIYTGEDSNDSAELQDAAPEQPAPAEAEAPQMEREIPPAPSAEERQAQHDAFKASSQQLDDALAGKLGQGRTAKDFEVTFERFIASIYMSALVQLGLVHEQNAQPQVDLVGARQTIDTIGMLSDKTKNNLTAQEENLLQNCLYELRMAYVDVTNMLTRPPQPGEGGPGGPIQFPGKK